MPLRIFIHSVFHMTLHIFIYSVFHMPLHIFLYGVFTALKVYCACVKCVHSLFSYYRHIYEVLLYMSCMRRCTYVDTYMSYIWLHTYVDTYMSYIWLWTHVYDYRHSSIQRDTAVLMRCTRVYPYRVIFRVICTHMTLHIFIYSVSHMTLYGYTRVHLMSTISMDRVLMTCTRVYPST